MAASLYSTRKRSGIATLSLIPLCLILLLGSPAKAQSGIDDRLAPQDTVEIRVSGWSASRDGVAQAALLNNTFTIGTSGTLALPMIGQVPAAGLRANELAKLITDRLQARGGVHKQSVTTVQRKQSTVASNRTNIKGHPSVAQPSANGSRTPVEPAATEQKQALARERSKADAFLPDLSVARIGVEAARGKALSSGPAAHDEATRNNQGIAAGRQRAATVRQELGVGRGEINALENSAQTGGDEREEAAAKAADPDAAKAKVTRASIAQREPLEQKSDKAVGPPRDRTAARKEIEILKPSGGSRTARIEDAPKARVTERAGSGATAPVRTGARSTRESALREVRRMAVRKPSRSVRLTTIVLPDALLPTKPPLYGLW